MNGKWSLVGVVLPDELQNRKKEDFTLGSPVTFSVDKHLTVKFSKNAIYTGSYSINTQNKKITIANVKEGWVNGEYDYKIFIVQENDFSRTEKLYLKSGEKYLDFIRYDNRTISNSLRKEIGIKYE
jgi:hypothetical protein